MNIYNIRLGHACNSSSSHSVIWFDGNPQTDETSGFGWENFVAADTESRRNYAALLVLSKLNIPYFDYGVNGAMLKAFAKEGLGVDLPEGAYIDHQSAQDKFHIPSGQYSTINMEFAKEFVSWFTNAPIAILGGNDNDDEPNPMHSINDPVPFIYSMKGKARKDPVYKCWTVFDPESGNKVRLDFSDKRAEAPDRSSLPELVDLKISDYCPYDCSFCYMGSTINGKHGDINFIGSIVDKLRDMQVFEVAIGGGEPTLHPQFIEITEWISNFANCNFTTKSLAWLRDPEQAKHIVKNCSAFAFSVGYDSDIEKLYNAWHPYKDSIQAVAQVVVETMPDWQLERILLEAKRFQIPVTLLGFKETGRGGSFEKVKCDWKKVVKKAGYKSIGIDTVLAKELPPEFDKTFFHTKEGAWSMYVDAVEKTAGPSSYCAEEDKVSILTYASYDKNKEYPRCSDLSEIFTGLNPQ